MISKQKILSSVVEIFDKAIPYQSFDLFIFGSQANKNELINSDIDVGIKASSPIDSTVLSNIKYQLNDKLSSLYTFDVVDFTTVSDSFAKVALKKIEILAHDKRNSTS